MVPYTGSPLSGNLENAAQINLSYSTLLHLYRFSDVYFNNRIHEHHIGRSRKPDADPYGVNLSNSYI